MKFKDAIETDTQSPTAQVNELAYFETDELSRRRKKIEKIYNKKTELNYKKTFPSLCSSNCFVVAPGDSAVKL